MLEINSECDVCLHAGLEGTVTQNASGNSIANSRWTREDIERVEAAKIELRGRSVDVTASSGSASSAAAAALADNDKLNVNRIKCPELDEIYEAHQRQYVDMMMRKERLKADNVLWKDVLAECKSPIFELTLMFY